MDEILNNTSKHDTEIETMWHNMKSLINNPLEEVISKENKIYRHVDDDIINDTIDIR